MILRCAVYARFSSEKQSPLSIEDQIRKCREYAQARGWSVLDSHIYVDEAVSGATDDRLGLRQMLAAATGEPKPFDVVLVDDTSRISRTLREPGTKVHRGVEGKALNCQHTGGRCFGYRNVPIEDPTRVDQHGRTLI